MEWSTIYISGKPGFKEEVLRNLEGSRFPYMPGTSESESVSLFWIDERSTIRNFKKAIGSKTVFKYRLQFYTSIEKYYESVRNNREVTFTPQERALISEMSAWQAGKQPYKHSA
jgi:hypothetical protein